MYVLTLRFLLDFTEGQGSSLFFRIPQCSAHTTAGSGRFALSSAVLLGTRASWTAAAERAGSSVFAETDEAAACTVTH